MSHHKRYKTKYCRDNRKHNRADFGIPCFDVCFQRCCISFFQDIVIFVQNIDICIDRDAAQQHERSKTALVEIQFKQVEGQENPDESNRDNKNNRKRLFQ